MDKIKDIIPHVIEKISSQKPEEQIRLQEIWGKLVGESGQRHTAIQGWHEGVLTIRVDSSVWLFQMNLKKKSFLSELQKVMPAIKDMIFRIGKI